MTELEYWRQRCARGLRATDYNELTVDQVTMLTLLIESFLDKQKRPPKDTPTDSPRHLRVVVPSN